MNRPDTLEPVASEEAVEDGGEIEARRYKPPDVGDQRDACGHGGVASRYRGPRGEVRRRWVGVGEGGIDNRIRGEDWMLRLEGELYVDEGRDSLYGAVILSLV